MDKSFYVATKRTQHNKTVLKLESVPFVRQEDAEQWGEFIRSENKSKPHLRNFPVLVVQVVAEVTE